MPNGGSPAYTPETQRLFWEAYAREGPLVAIDVPVRTWISFAAAFEAFDMQWKGEKTGTPIEGHWGFLNVNREPYPAFEAWRQAFRSANEAKARASGACPDGDAR